MMRRQVSVCALLLLALSVVSPAAQQVMTITGKVVGVADGDTITVLDATNRQHKVRFQGIDAPESNQAFGSRSKQSLSEMVFGKPIIVQYYKTDKYGRPVGKVLGGGRDINLEQLRAGMAWFYRFYEKELSKDLCGSRERGEGGAPGPLARPGTRCAVGLPAPGPGDV